jgi:hypothetical protein
MTAKKTFVLSVLAALFVAGAAVAAPAMPQCGDDHGDKTKDGKGSGDKKPST